MAAASSEQVDDHPGAGRRVYDRALVDHATALVGEVCAAHDAVAIGFLSFDPAHAGAASNAETGPYLRLILAVDTDRVMGGGRALVFALRAALVGAHARVGHDALPVERELVAEHAAMAVGRIRVGAKRAAVEDQATVRRPIANDRVSGIGQQRQVW